MPNNNNWLSFSMSASLRSSLTALTLSVASSDSLCFNPVASAQLHMTAVFLGEQYKDKKHAAALNTFLLNSRACRTLCGARLSFVGLSLFPPNKHNLLVAVFAPPSQTQHALMHNAVFALKQELRDDAALAFKIPHEETFVFHVTLGKFALTTLQIEKMHQHEIHEIAHVMATAETSNVTKKTKKMKTAKGHTNSTNDDDSASSSSSSSISDGSSSSSSGSSSSHSSSSSSSSSSSISSSSNSNNNSSSSSSSSSGSELINSNSNTNFCRIPEIMSAIRMANFDFSKIMLYEFHSPDPLELCGEK